jgi:hypothetical protein
MDTETIIALIIVVVGVLWNLIVKMREKMAVPDSVSPWAAQEEQAETYMEDLSPYTIIEEKVQVPLSKSMLSAEDDSFLLSGVNKRKVIPDAKPTYHRSGRRKRRSQYGCTSQSKLQEAVVWSEILAPPLALR